MGELAYSVRRARDSMFDAIQAVIDEAERADNTNISALHDALSETIKQRDELQVYNTNQQSMINKLDKELAHARTQVQNLQEFNDNQRKQLESLQKEMAAIHMCVTATSRTKLYDAMESYTGVSGELPFLLKAVATYVEKSFDTKDAAERYVSRIRAARHELES